MMKNSSGNDSTKKEFSHEASEKTLQLRKIDKMVRIIAVCAQFIIFIAFVGIMLAFLSMMIHGQIIGISREVINCFVYMAIALVIMGILIMIKQEIVKEIKLDHTYSLTVENDILVYKKQGRTDIGFRLPCFAKFVIKGEKMPNGKIAMQDTIILVDAAVYLDLDDEDADGRILEEFLAEVGYENFL